ncbi:uncharacterized protein LOC128244744 [Mya arenaria]|uniref:uncharacterized protein LOC128244744 n=1 Tax=Mya arenaria TaxID=6604 RepID=UPI0022E02485|nr:uncharacterized protein LOC128244744 [Mya arenaria]
MKFRFRRTFLFSCYLCILFYICFETDFHLYLSGILMTDDINRSHRAKLKNLSEIYVNNFRKSTETPRIATNLVFDSDNVTSTCARVITCPIQSASSGTWIEVGSDNNMFIFSAFYVEKDKHVIIVGAKERGITRATCQHWHVSTDGQMVMEESPLSIKKSLAEGHGKQYASYLFKCSPPGGKMPRFVSVVKSNCTVPPKILLVKPTRPAGSYGRQFTVCLMPLNLNYSRAYELVEWIELNRLLGADKFMIYNESSAPNVNKVLNYYAKRDIVDVIQWPIPLDNREIHYFGQVAMLQDCLYRNKEESEFIVNEDLDEFIIPRPLLLKTWHDFVKNKSEDIAGYIFRCTFFRKEWVDTEIDFSEKRIAEKYKLITLLRFGHETKLWNYKARSKYFARTSTVESLMIHEVPSVKTENVHQSIAMIHHYRNWSNFKPQEKVHDDIVLQKYGKQLLKNVAATWDNLPGVALDN